MPAGQPTKYTPEVIKKIPLYLSTVGREQTALPTKYGFAKYIKVNDDTLVEWEKSYPQFSAAIKAIERAQKQQLMDDGMYGGKEVNSTMAIFLLKANHGLIETQRTELTGLNGEPFKLNVIAGNAFNYIPGSLPINATSGRGTLGGQPQIQDISMAQTGTKDDDSNH